VCIDFSTTIYTFYEMKKVDCHCELIFLLHSTTVVLVQVLEDTFYGMKKLDQPSVPVQVLVRVPVLLIMVPKVAGSMNYN
jgi:predicted nucleic acid-binding protein